MVVRELITRLGFQLNNAQVQNAERATSRLKQQADQAAQSFRNIVTGFFAIQAVRGIVSIGDSIQSLEARIGLLPQTVGDAGDTLDTLVDRANVARMSIDAYGNLYVRLAGSIKNFMPTQEEAIQVTDAIAQSLVVSGTNAQEAASATLQLSQAFQKGKLDGDEFRAFMENLSQDFKDKLAEEIGTTADKLFDLSSSGQLTAKKLAEAFSRMAPEIEKRLLTIPLTVGQATTIVSNKFTRMISHMNRESMFITKIAKFITESFDSIEKGVDSVVKSFDGWNNLLRYIGAALLAGTAILIGFSTASIAALAPWLLIGAAIALAALVIEDLMVAAEGGESVFLSIAETISGWYDSIVKAIDDGLAYAENAVLDTIKGWSDALYRMFVETIPKAIRDAWNAVTSLPGTIIESIKSGASALTGGGAAFGVTPSSVATATGNRTVVSNNTNNVSIQVPAGTGLEQVEFVKNGTQKYMDSLNKPMTTRDAMAYGG